LVQILHSQIVYGNILQLKNQLRQVAINMVTWLKPLIAALLSRRIRTSNNQFWRES